MKKFTILIMVLIVSITIPIFGQTSIAYSDAGTLSSMPPEGIPVLSSLENVFLSCQGEVSWTSTENTWSYHFQIATDNGFSNIDIDKSGIESTSIDTIVSSTDTEYFVRVCATNAAGDGDYSDVLSFTTPGLTFIDVGSNSVPAVIDVDGNGLLDVFIGRTNGKISRYEQSAVGSLELTLISDNFSGIDIGNNSAPTFGDIDGDGLLDLLVGKSGGTLVHFEQDAAFSTSFTKVSSPFSEIDVNGAAIPVFTDLDGDGCLDLIVGQKYGNVRYYEQEAEYSTSFSLINGSLVQDVGYYAAPAVCDYDGDGYLEMIEGCNGGAIYYYDQSTSDNTSFTLETSEKFGIDVGVRSTVATTDLNGDGKIDWLIGEEDGILNIYEGETSQINSSCVTTTTASSVDDNTATLGGNISDNNDASVVLYGICYATTELPSLADSRVLAGSGTGSFSITLSELSAGTTYYARTFASSSYGTFYGNVVPFSTTGDQSLPVELSSFSARKVNSTVVLEWITESETDNKGFIIERSIEENSWITISTYMNNSALKGQGSTSVQSNYSYIDKEVDPGMTYNYRISDVSTDGEVEVHASLSITLEALPELTRMDAAYPNPFNPSTLINYQLAEDSRVDISVYDIRGSKVQTLYSGHQSAGSYNVYWNGKDKSGNIAALGAYFIRMQAGNTHQVQKVLLMK